MSNASHVSVAYAGSLVNIMQQHIRPAFDQATGYSLKGEGKGSTALANEIKQGASHPDVFISADPQVNALLMGQANNNYVSWYITFGHTELVIGYATHGPLAPAFRAAAEGLQPWYQILTTPGIRFGRTDPQLDPKGYNTLFLFQLAQCYYQQPQLLQRVLGGEENASQIFPEEELVRRVRSGELDAGVFYLDEVKHHRVPFLTLPSQINLGDPSLADLYATVGWTNPKTQPPTSKVQLPLSAFCCQSKATPSL